MPGVGGEKRPPGHQPGGILHQTKNVPFCPVRMAVGGVAMVAVVGYLVLYSKKKPEATAMDVARVTTGTATPDNTRPHHK
ncbi:hypothetical protein Dimus_034838 [Dionaea muscipula]